jgi:hypothetical protein
LSSVETLSDVALENYFARQLPAKLPAPRRKGIIRLRGTVIEIETRENLRLVHLGDTSKPLAFTHALATPGIGDMIEGIASVGKVWYFVKTWVQVKESKPLKADLFLQELILQTLAGSPDQLITADDCHNPSITAYLNSKAKAQGKEKTEWRAIGPALAALAKQRILRTIKDDRGEPVRLCSRRSVCHHRSDLRQWTWAE